MGARIGAVIVVGIAAVLICGCWPKEPPTQPPTSVEGSMGVFWAIHAERETSAGGGLLGGGMVTACYDPGEPGGGPWWNMAPKSSAETR